MTFSDIIFYLCVPIPGQVLHRAILTLDMSECTVGDEELGLLWRLCPRLKTLDLGLRRGSRDTVTSQGEEHTMTSH